MYKILENYSTRNNKFNLTKKTIIFKLCEKKENNNLTLPNRNLTRLFDNVIQKHIKKGIDATFCKIGLTVHIAGMDEGVLHIEYRNLNNLDGGVVTNRLETLVQSNRKINFNGKITLTATIFTMKNKN